MSTSNNSSRERIIKAASELFLTQGISETTTKEIADVAQVNEVTIFRQFKSKYGLLLAVIEESGVFTYLGESVIKSRDRALRATKGDRTSDSAETIQDYATTVLEYLEEFPEIVCSVIGEAQQYPQENRIALGKGITEVNRHLAQGLREILQEEETEQLAGLLHAILLGYGVIEFTCESHELWQDRADFLSNLVKFWTKKPKQETSTLTIRDLPPQLVHFLLQKAKKQGKQIYAIVYLLFGAGLTPQEIINLERSHHIYYPQGQLIQITQGSIREVSVNQSILGKRYGSYTRNPLTQWLRTRQDNNPALFINTQGKSLSLADLTAQWQELVRDLPASHLPTLEQTQQTWCVEMLTRGMSLENLQLLIGWDLAKLQPYAQRAKEKTALAEAFLLDH
ncbi:TetR/AcrR family transcriptional regulator [Gloeocapsa sp. PCC 73106]|uniref:TetR/AcrR family transcriptional regulator n=1 Tax=Gloeocapsa sp. PCC 73106 TaxID=102232 RepID=UPI0002AC775C|nr:TetR/AcrR family transcriptional regulator [Gloeocapsa sp. PCC 73106]ELR96938.1 transcriptional regulator [Gloeocapsa sp. PCC 73106]